MEDRDDDEVHERVLRVAEYLKGYGVVGLASQLKRSAGGTDGLRVVQRATEWKGRVQKNLKENESG